MPVNVKYKGGPRDGKKATLKNFDIPPNAIRADADAKALNCKSGYYSLVKSEANDEQFQYVWVS